LEFGIVFVSDVKTLELIFKSIFKHY